MDHLTPSRDSVFEVCRPTKYNTNNIRYEPIKNIFVTVKDYKNRCERELLHPIPACLSFRPKIPEIITRSGNQRDCSSPKEARSKLPLKGNVLSRTDTNGAEYSIYLLVMILKCAHK